MCRNVVIFHCSVSSLYLGRRHIPEDHNIDAYSHAQFYTVSLLSWHRAQHIQRVEGELPGGHDVTAVELRDEINRNYLLIHFLTYSVT